MEVLFHTLENADAWDSLVLRAPNYTFFHSMAWARAVISTYGFRMRYLSVHDKDDFAAIPLMIVRTPLSKPRIVCLPFSDFCGPVSSSPAILDALMKYLARQGEFKRWKELEIKEDLGIPGFVRCERFCEHVLPLDQGVEKAFQALRSSTRRNIQKAEREGIRVEISRDVSAMEVYYRLHCITRRRLGIPPQSKDFFLNIYRHVIQPGNGLIVKSRHRGKTIAASVFLHFGKTAVYKFGASLPDDDHLRPSNLVMWGAIRWYAENGFKTLSLGRTDPDDAGLMQYKNGWGGECREIRYNRWPPRTYRDSAGQGKYLRMSLPAVRALPVPALRFFGSIAYRFLS